MKSLEEHNQERSIAYQDIFDSKPTPNGIECPECKGELYDTQPNMVLASYPPMKNVGCLRCKYSGYRVV
jgi:hypothetical protein